MWSQMTCSPSLTAWAHSSGSQVTGTRMPGVVSSSANVRGVGRVRDDGGDVGEHVGAGDVAAELAGQRRGQAGGEVRGPVGVQVRQCSGRRAY